MTSENARRNGDGSQRGLRRTNAKRVIEALRSEGPSSQAALARRAGLSRAAVNNIVHSLVADGLLQVTEGNTGRETLVSLAAASGSIIAIDLGRRRIRASLVSFDREERFDEVIDLDRDLSAHGDAAAVTALVSKLLDHAAVTKATVSQVCVAVHAPYNDRTGTVAPASFLPDLQGLDVRAALEAQLQLPVFADNDTNFSALAEWVWGAGRGSEHFYYVEGSDSIGSGFVLGGRIYHGSNGTAGEIGHVIVDDRGTLCTCGSRGCLAAVASGRAILRQLEAAGNPKPSIRAVVESARAGDASCARILQEAGQHLGRALTHVVRILAPEAVVIGGSLAAAGPLVLESVRAALDPNVLGVGAPPVRVAVGLLRSDMCILGCIAHALSERSGGLSALPDWLLTPVGYPATARPH